LSFLWKLVRDEISLSTNKPYQQHLPKMSQNVSGAVHMTIRYAKKYLHCSITAMLEL